MYLLIRMAPNLSKRRLSSRWIILQKSMIDQNEEDNWVLGGPGLGDTSTTQFRGHHHQKEDWETLKARGPECLLQKKVFSIWEESCTHEMSAMLSFKQDLSNYNTGSHATAAAAKGSSWLLKQGESAFSRDKHPDGLSSPKWSPKQIDTQATLHDLSRICMGVCECVCV